MYPIPQSPLPTTSGYVPPQSNTGFKPIHPAAPKPVLSVPAADQGTFGSLLNMVNSPQGTCTSPGSSIQCEQGTSAQANSTASPQSSQSSKSNQSQPSPNHQVSHSFPHPIRMLPHCNLLH